MTKSNGLSKISVIIPTFNHARYISAAIGSALAQTLKPFEIIVVDDGSTDDTENVVRGFGDRIGYIRQDNEGVCAARNRGVAASTGDFLAFLDADDSWEPTKLDKQAAKFAEDPEVGLVHCGMREFDSATGKTIAVHLIGADGWVAENIALWEGPVIVGPGGTIVVRREIFEEVGGYDTNLRNGEDWEFCFRVAKQAKVGFVAEPLVNYRMHGANAHKNVKEMERSTLIAWGKVFDGSDPEIERLRARSYGNLHKVLAGSYLHQSDYGGFLRNVLKSLWYRPSYLGFYFAQISRRGRTELRD